MKKVLLYIIICLIVIASPIVYFTIKSEKEEKDFNNSWLIEVTSDYLNIRKTPDLYEYQPLGEIKKGEKYKVLEIKLDNEKYVWYKINWNDREVWIASNRNEPTVKEYNNPNYDFDEEKEDNYKIDYVKPEIKYKETTYKTESIDTITYDHLEIIEDSEYKITSKVYIEDCTGWHQYWIVYTVTDSFGNKNSKTQHIVFEKEPNKKQVSNLKEIRSNVCLEELN